MSQFFLDSAVTGDPRWLWPPPDAPEPDGDELSDSSILIDPEAEPLGPWRPDEPEPADLAEAWNRHFRRPFQRRFVAVLIRDGGRCHWCGDDLLASPEALGRATLDHVLPRSQGGHGRPSNVVLACTTCNGLREDFTAPTLAEVREHVLAKRRKLAERFACLAPLVAAAETGERLLALRVCLEGETPRQGRLLGFYTQAEADRVQRQWLLRERRHGDPESRARLFALPLDPAPEIGGEPCAKAR